MPNVLNSPNTFYSYSITPNLTYNIKSWLEYGLLELGAYTNVTLTNNASSLSTLKRSYDNSYPSGSIYEFFGGGLVWESSVVVPSGYTSPFQVSGVYIGPSGGQFYAPSTSGSYPFYVDYQRGRCVFPSGGVLAGTIVKAEYSFRDVNIYIADDPRWLNTVSDMRGQFDQMDTLEPSGLSSIIKANRLQMPCVVIDAKERSQGRGLQLGGGQITPYTFIFHIFAEQPHHKRALMDLIADQQERVLRIFDVNRIEPPFKYNGTLSPSGQSTYPTLSDRNGQYFATFARINGTRQISPPAQYGLFRGQVYMDLEVDRYLLY